jgi:hypothetical protein
MERAGILFHADKARCAAFFFGARLTRITRGGGSLAR